MELLTTDACTLPTADRPLRLAEFDTLFATAVRTVERRVEDRGNVVRLRLAGGERLIEQVRDLTAREASCCTFFTFRLDGTDDDLTLSISVPSARQDILAALADRAEELSA